MAREIKGVNKWVDQDQEERKGREAANNLIHKACINLYVKLVKVEIENQIELLLIFQEGIPGKNQET
jgi:hypothetical protein